MTLVIKGGPTNAGRKRPLQPRKGAWECCGCASTVPGYWARCPKCNGTRPPA